MKIAVANGIIVNKDNSCKRLLHSC